MGFAVRYSFETGFDNYIQEREQQRLDDLVLALKSEYLESDGWDSSDRKKWPRLLRFSNESSHRVHSVLRLSLLDENGNYIAGVRSHHGDSQQKLPIVINGKTVGWVVSSTRLPKVINDEIDRQFQDRQLYATWLIIGFSVFLAIFVSLLLARILVVPVKRLASATQKLAGGDYDVTVDSNSSDEISLLAQNFNKLAYSLKRNQQLRHELMAEISHELRTPLAILRGEIEAIQDGLKPADDKALESLLNEVKQLSHLINDLYELSLADAGALNYRMQKVDLSDILNSQLSLIKDRFTRNNLDLQSTIQDKLYIQADEQRLIQLLNNLLENSLRYTNSPGTISITLARVDKHISLVIDDSEPGIDANLINNIFDRFYRVEQSRNREFGGSGLGLAIVKQIVMAHGGEISADISKLGGISIKINFPVLSRYEDISN